MFHNFSSFFPCGAAVLPFSDRETGTVLQGTLLKMGMKLKSRYWSKIYRSHIEDWTKGVLSPCTSDELEALCRLLGVPYSGTKGAKITRLLDMANLRMELTTWGEYKDDDYVKAHEKAHEIATDICVKFKRVDLVAMARRAKAFYSLPKRGIVISLLQWRDRCRMRGQQFNELIKKTRKVQYVLPGFC